MKKILKTIAMLLVVAAVVSAAGCAGKTNTAENGNQGASEQVTPASAITPAETPASAITPAETSASTITPAEVPSVTNENVTENTTTQTGTHISNTQRKLAIAQNHTQSSGTQNVSQ
jgi:inhibitor of cysteine peptidase